MTNKYNTVYTELILESEYYVYLHRAVQSGEETRRRLHPK
jgi:hypothetical protein